jgi:hypothetical protein
MIVVDDVGHPVKGQTSRQTIMLVEHLRQYFMLSTPLVSAQKDD